VKIRLKNSYGELGPYEKGEIDKVFDGMYGEKTYQVYIEARDCWERWVPARDLEHWKMSREEARATREVYELRKQIKAGERINRRQGSFEEPQARGGRRTRYRSDRRWDGSQAPSPQRGATRGGGQGRQPYAQSEPDHQPYNATDAGRANSVPPQNYTWPQFIADLTHAVYNRDKDGNPADYEADERKENQIVDHVRAPDELHDHYQGDRDKNADDYDDNPRGQYDDEIVNPREAVSSIKNGDMGDEYNVGTRDDRRRNDFNAATKGAAGRNAGGGPLIYIHCHQEPPVSVRRDLDYYDNGRTPGTRRD